MNLVDTHTHLFLEQFENDWQEVIQRAIDQNVTKMLLPAIESKSYPAIKKLCEVFPGNCFPMTGLHPCSVDDNFGKELELVYNNLKNKTMNWVAVGEIGIDLYWDKTFINQQKEALAQQIEWAKEFQFPIVIHVRDSFDETFEVIDKLNDNNLTGVFHCFTGTKEQADHIISYGGFKLGIGGVVTFKNSGVEKIIEQIDVEHLILETDSPYLTPVPFRGKRNESYYVNLVAKKLSEIYDLPLTKIAEITTKNANALFKLS